MSFEHDSALLSIGELAERADVSRRTIRFYVQRGLIAPPLGGGRGSHYTERHLERLLAVKRMQEVGVPLDVILRRLGPPDAAEPLGTPAAPEVASPASSGPARRGPTAGRAVVDDSTPSPSDTWRRHVLAPGVELLVRDDALSPSALEDLVHTACLIARRDRLDHD